MNAKKAKTIRRVARALSVGAPERKLQWRKGTKRNGPNTTRGVARQLKARFRDAGAEVAGREMMQLISTSTKEKTHGVE